MTDTSFCKTCFTTSNFPEAEINGEGSCRWCRTNIFGQLNKSITSPRISELMQVAGNIKKQRKGNYDCIIGVSGGMDSTNVVYIAKKVMGLNPLLVHYDHGFNYETPEKNLRSLADVLGVDLRILKSRGNWDKKYVSEIIKAFSKSRLYWGICTFCNYVLPAAVLKVACEENIPVLLKSSNFYESFLYISSRVKLKAMVNRIFGDGFWNIPVMSFHLVLGMYYLLRLKMEFYVPPVSNLIRKAPRIQIQVINVNHYIPGEVKEIHRALSKEAGWNLPKHPNVGMRFDCMIEDGYINHTYKQVTGATVHSIIANNLVYGGVFTKESLAEAVMYYDQVIDKRKQQVLQRMAENELKNA